MLRIRFHVNFGSKSHFRMSLQKYIEACLYNMIKLGKFKGYLPGFFFVFLFANHCKVSEKSCFKLLFSYKTIN